MDLLADLKTEINELDRKKKLFEDMRYEIAHGFEVSGAYLSMEFELLMMFSDPLIGKDLVNDSLKIWERKFNTKEI